MNIGFVIYGSLNIISGGYLYDYKLVEHLRKNGDTVDIISLPWRNYAVHLTDNFHFRLPSNYDILIQDELNHPSLIWANQGKHSYSIISIVHHLRSTELRPRWQNILYRWPEKKYLNSVDGFIFNSQTTKQETEKVSELQQPYIVGYPAGNRLGTINRNELFDRLSYPLPLRILFIGNIIPRKGLHVLLDAVAQLPLGSVTVNIAGGLSRNARYTNIIKKQIKRLSIDKFLTFHGTFSDQTLIQLLKKSHILTLPSSYEGFGIALLEAMAFGLPTIGTMAGAAKEIIKDGKTGFIIPPENATVLAEKIYEFINSPRTLYDMSFAALKNFNTFPTWEKSLTRVRSFLVKQLPVNRSKR